MPELSAGIIGCGRIAGARASRDGHRVTHAQAVAGHGGFRLVAVSDPDPERAQQFAGRWGCEAVEDVAVLGLDLVAVCTPDGTHADHILRLLTAAAPPRMIVVEKPLCITAAEADAIRAAAAGVPSTIVVNHTRRFDAGHLAVRDLVLSGDLGPVLGVRWTHYGGWLHNGVHVVDTLRLILGAEVEPVRVERGWEDRPGDPCVEAVFGCPAHPGARILVESFPGTGYQLFEGEVRLRDARIRLVDFGDEIWVDEVVTNAASERELKSSRRLVAGTGATAMETLYDLAARSLRGDDRDLIARAGLAQALATMTTLFDTAARLSP